MPETITPPVQPPSLPPPPAALTFEERYPAIIHEIDKRKWKWTLNSTPFEDIKQMILIKVHRKYDMFDPNKIVNGRRVEFSHWVNVVISNTIKSALRDLYLIHSRPCIQKCPFNTGNDTCSKTSTGKQCGECLLYRDWERRKLDHFNVKETLPIENHMREADGQPNDFVDIDGKKEVIDRCMKLKLTKYEWRIYRALYVQGKSEKEAGKMLGLKKVGHMWAGYQQILALKKKFVALAKQVIEEEGLV